MELTSEVFHLLGRSADMISDLNEGHSKSATRLEAELRAFIRGPKTPIPVEPALYETPPPLTMTAPGGHEHYWALAMEMEEPGMWAKDCPCGVRAIFTRDTLGTEKFVRFVTTGTSRDNAVYSVKQYVFQP